MSAEGRDAFLVWFNGGLVECSSIADALAIKLAARILSDPAACESSLREIDDCANVMERYGFADATATLSRVSCRVRARRFLVERMGYVQPRRAPLARA
jgi:hypothetical protein